MTQLKQAFRKFFYGEGRIPGSLEPTLSMLLIGLVTGLLLQSMNLQNRNLTIDNLEKRIQFLELQLFLEAHEAVHSEKNGERIDEKGIRKAGEGTHGVRVCELG